MIRAVTVFQASFLLYLGNRYASIAQWVSFRTLPPRHAPSVNRASSTATMLLQAAPPVAPTPIPLQAPLPFSLARATPGLLAVPLVQAARC